MYRSMGSGARTALLSSLLWGLAPAQPITKTGACPQLTRYPAPAGEDWTSKQWQARPNGFDNNTLQNPLTPAQSINCIEVPAGMKAEVVASELVTGPTPKPAYLIHMNFDERGRLWALDARDYPNEIASNRLTGGKGRILIFEDSNGDGAMDTYKEFYKGLVIPTSLEFVKGGIVVTVAPYIYYFPNNNDVAGTPQTLFSGMGVTSGYDTHGQTNSLMYGLDNWIYGHTGYNSCAVNGVQCGGGRVWRFQHTALGHSSTAFESYTTGPANAHGIGQMEDGQIFQSGATLSVYFSHSIRKGVGSVGLVSGNELFYPITGDRWLWEGSTAKNAQGWFTSRTSAVSGLQFYTSRLLPRSYWNRFGFSCEGASKLCNQDSLSPNVSTWRVHRRPGPDRSNIIASTDAWVAPLLARTGPDGGVWVLDWYNYLFLHNPAGPAGIGGAWNNHLRVKERTRVYRILPTSGTPETVLNLANATVPQLVGALGNPNFTWRLHAQRQLIARGFSAELGTLLEDLLKKSRWEDAVGNDPAVTHAVWVLSGTGELDRSAARWNPILEALLKHPAWMTRRNVLMAMPRTTAGAQSISDACAVNDIHAHVRLQALVALSETGSKPSGMKAMWDTYRNADTHAGSAFTASGITSSATRPCEPVLDPRTPDPVAIGSLSPDRQTGQPRSDLRFVLDPEGFRLLPHGQLPTGELSVFAPDGRVAFRSGYRSPEGRWSREKAHGLKTGVYLYTFRGQDGTLIQGRLTLAGRL